MKRFFLIVAILTLGIRAVYAESPRLRSNHADKWLTVEDVRAEIDFGREVAARIIGKYSLYDNDALTRYVNLVGKSLAQYANRPELDFTVGILDSNIINAYAAPGGFIFITRGAIDAMENESELAGVLAHEIIHVSQKHIVRELEIRGSDNSSISGVSRLVGGATDAIKMAFVQAIDKAMNILLERGHKKDDELEADAMAVVLTAQANYDPRALLIYFEKIKKNRGEEMASIKKLHPPFEERIKLIKKAIEKGGLSGDGKGEARFKKNRSDKG